MRAFLAVAFAVALTWTLSVLAMSPAPQEIRAPSSGPPPVALRTWLDAVQQHRPGTADAAASAIAAWTSDDLERLLPDVVWYLDHGRRQVQPPASPAGTGHADCASCAASQRERERLVRGTRSRAPEDGRLKDFPLPARLNDLIIRAVMLHSDAAMYFRSPLAASQEPDRFERLRNVPGRPNLLAVPRAIVNAGDGQFVGTTAAGGQWHMARALLQFMTPEPALTPLARQWYLAASAYFAAMTNFGQLDPHLAAWQLLFPDDATLAFDRGWQSETSASPMVQQGVRSLLAAALARAPGRLPVVDMQGRFSTSYCNSIVPCDEQNNPYGVKNERDSLADAERHFARAMRLEPTMAEAYVRLAHVRTRLGRHAEALSVLGTLPASADTDVTFYAALAEGRALDALGRTDAAVDAYRRANRLFPEAQSANLALSDLERKRGNSSAAADFARRAVAAPGSNEPAIDPFAVYIHGRGRSVDATWRSFIARMAQP